MKLKNLNSRWIFVALLLVALGGCATPKSVTELEKDTSLNTASLSQQLQAFAANHQKIVTAREQTYANEVATTASLQGKLDSLIAIQRLAGNTDIVTLYQNIVAESDLEASNHLATLNLLSDTITQMDKGVAKVSAPSKQLDSIAKNLADLASQDTLKSRAEALLAFYSDVAGQVAKAEAAGTNAVNKALTNAPPTSAATAAADKFSSLLNP